VNIPYEGEDAYEREVWEIAALQPGFLMLQDWDFKGYGIPVEVILRLFEEIEKFQCLKLEVVPAGVKYSEVLARTGNRLHVSGGWAGTQMIEALDRGVNAFMPSILLGVYARIFALHRAGQRSAAMALFNRFVPILAFSHQHLDISIHFNKRLLREQGLFTNVFVREPILVFDHIHEKVSREIIAAGMALEKEVLESRSGG
jgi:4-hydroxy-tetrahydrodipicolinate synthase